MAALLGCSLWVSARAGRSHGQIRLQLEQPSEAALREDWPAVAVITEQLQRQWEDELDFSAAFGYHQQLDEVEAGLARLEVYLARRQAADYGAQSAALARQVEALEESHRLSLRNLR